MHLANRDITEHLIQSMKYVLLHLISNKTWREQDTDF